MNDKNYFKRLDYTKQDIPSKPFVNLTYFGSTENIEYMPITEFLQKTSKAETEKIFDFTKSKREKNCGLGEAYIHEVKEKLNSGVYIRIKKTANSPHSNILNAHSKKENTQNINSPNAGANIIIRFNMDEKNNVLYDMNYIHIEAGQKAKIFLYLDAAKYDYKTANLFHNGLCTVIAEQESDVELITVQNLPHCGINFETVKLHAMRHAKVHFYDIQLGAKINGVSSSVYLPEDRAVVQVFPLYFADKDRRIDLEHNLIVNGTDSLASISARGALKNKARKIFRGNIFLNKGCSRSTARFADNTIMLDKTAVGAAIPTIFCDEDDVIGEHAASFEAVNCDKLYYLMTRGFDELSAKKLIIEAAFKPVFTMIDDEEIREQLFQELRVSLNEVTG